MVATAITILAFLLIVGLIFWVLGQVPGIPEPIRKVVYIILVVIVVLIIVGWLLGWSGNAPSIAFPRR
jgi:membrane protein DedA with SNARE-associated domain